MQQVYSLGWKYGGIAVQCNLYARHGNGVGARYLCYKGQQRLICVVRRAGGASKHGGCKMLERGRQELACPILIRLDGWMIPKL